MNALSFMVNTGVNASVNVTLGALSAAFATGIAAVGVAGSVFSIVTGGKFSSVNEVADFTVEAKSILPCLYMPLAVTLNPGFSIESKGSLGSLTKTIAAPIFRQAQLAASQEGLFAREVVSRVSYGLGVLVAAVTRAADLVLGLVAATLSIFPLIARVKEVNEFAFCHLLSLGVVNDVCVGLRGVINPQQFVKVALENEQESLVIDELDLVEVSLSE